MRLNHVLRNKTKKITTKMKIELLKHIQNRNVPEIIHELQKITKQVKSKVETQGRK